MLILSVWEKHEVLRLDLVSSGWQKGVKDPSDGVDGARDGRWDVGGGGGVGLPRYRYLPVVPVVLVSV